MKYSITLIALSLLISSCVGTKTDIGYSTNKQLTIESSQAFKPRILFINAFGNSFYNSTVINAYAWTLQSTYENTGNPKCGESTITKQPILTEYNNFLFKFNPKLEINKFFKKKTGNNLVISEEKQKTWDINKVENLTDFDYLIRIHPTQGSSVKYHGYGMSYDLGGAVGFGGFFDARNPLGSVVTKMFSGIQSIFFYYTADEIHWNLGASIYDVKNKQVKKVESINEYKFTSKNNDLGKALFDENSNLRSINHICEFDSKQIKIIDTFIRKKSDLILNDLFKKVSN